MKNLGQRLIKFVLALSMAFSCITYTGLSTINAASSVVLEEPNELQAAANQAIAQGMRYGNPTATWSNLTNPNLKAANCADFATWVWGYYMSKAADSSEEQLAANNRLINDIKTGLRAFNDIVGSNQGTTGHSALWWAKVCCYFARTNRKYTDSTGNSVNAVSFTIGSYYGSSWIANCKRVGSVTQADLEKLQQSAIIVFSELQTTGGASHIAVHVAKGADACHITPIKNDAQLLADKEAQDRADQKAKENADDIAHIIIGTETATPEKYLLNTQRQIVVSAVTSSEKRDANEKLTYEDFRYTLLTEYEPVENKRYTA